MIATEINALRECTMGVLNYIFGFVQRVECKKTQDTSLDEDTSLGSMLQVEDIADWCINFIEYFDWCNEYTKTQVLDTSTASLSHYVLCLVLGVPCKGFRVVHTLKRQTCEWSMESFIQSTQPKKKLPLPTQYLESMKIVLQLL